MIRRIALAFVSILLCITAFAQSANILSYARAEIQRRGLDEFEVRARLLDQGVDVDAITPAQFGLYRNRVIAVMDQLQAEKAAQQAGFADTTALAKAPLYPTQLPQTTPQEENAETALVQQQKDAHNPEAGAGELAIFGHELFSGKSMAVFRTTDGAQAPDTYVLGEGDEIHISIFGYSQTEIHQRIAADGSIQPNGSSKIFLKGLTLAQGRETIKNKLSQHYSFRQDQIAVAITTARTITVSIYGEVKTQGGFTVSALNTAFNALAAAGGPSEIGSLRNVQRSRGGKTTRLDLYQYMTGAVSGDQYDLQNNDILFIPVAERIVTIQGAVNRPMRYEMAAGETVADLIRYAGGLTYGAYRNFVQIERYRNGEKVLLEYNLQELLNGGRQVNLEGGDIVLVKDAQRELEQYVAIGGDVYYGGHFDLERNSSLKTLLESAKPRYTARTDYVFVERTRDDKTMEVLTVPFPGVKGNADFRLQARDSVVVLEQATYSDMDTLSVTGQVRKPFARPLGLHDHMSVSQAIEYAGGLKPSVYPMAYIFRKDLTNPVKMEYIPVSLEADGDRLLQPGDELRVYDKSTYTNPGEVRIAGAVKNPVGVTFDGSLKLRDLITMAGGFEMGAALNRVEIFRLNLSDRDEAKFRQFTISVDQKYNPTDPDFHLEPFDQVIVRMMPSFNNGRTVELNGRVRYPGIYVLEDSHTQLSDIIKLAGGLLDDANPYTTIFRTYRERGPIGVNVRDALRHHDNMKYDPFLMDGDVINITRMENTVTILEKGTLLGQYVPDEYSQEQRTVTYQGKHRANWYIRRQGGGFQKYADRNSVTVTLPNNQSKGTKRILGFIRCYPTVEPGSVITLSIDEKRKEKAEEPKEKVRWDQVAASTLSALTSVVSMILLIERLN